MKFKTANLIVLQALLCCLSVVLDLRASEPETVCMSDQIWLVSARQHCECSCSSEFPVQFYSCNGWHDSDFGTLIGTNHSSMRTVVFVHGYQTDLCDAQTRGVQVFKNLFGCCQDRQPIRFVIWAWKSEKEIARRPLQDFSIISQRAISLGPAFAHTMDLVANDGTVVVAYSLGAQVVVSGMTGNCQYGGPPIQLAVIAAANDCGFASCCRDRICGCNSIAGTTIFLNNKDRAIRASNMICRLQYGRHYRKFDELAVCSQGALGCVNLVDVSGEASKKHSVVRYTALPTIGCVIRRLVCECGMGCGVCSDESQSLHLQSIPDRVHDGA